MGRGNDSLLLDLTLEAQATSGLSRAQSQRMLLDPGGSTGLGRALTVEEDQMVRALKSAFLAFTEEISAWKDTWNASSPGDGITVSSSTLIGEAQSRLRSHRGHLDPLVSVLVSGLVAVVRELVDTRDAFKSSLDRIRGESWVMMTDQTTTFTF